MKPSFSDAFFTPWSQISPTEIPSIIESKIQTAEEKLQAIASNEGPFTFESTYGAFEEATEDLDIAWTIVGHLDSVCNSDELREAHNAVLPKISEFYASITLRPDLWAVLKQAADSLTSASADLTPIESRFVEETVRDFVRQGADLPEDQRQRLQTLGKELSQKTQKFSENVLDSTNAWEWVIDDETKLAGLPELAKEAARQDALSKGHGSEDEPRWRFTLQAPSFGPVLDYVEDETVRKTIWEALTEIGRAKPHDNTTLIQEILKLRQEKAEILGKSNFGDYALEPRMAKNASKALSFVDDLFERVRGQFQDEIGQLETFRGEKLGKQAEQFEPWNIAFWSEKLRKEKYGFDEEELRPYFPLRPVIDGMFALTEELFQVTLKERETCFIEEPTTPSAPPSEGPIEVWHPEVQFYEIYDKKSEEHLGSFYADWHPRESKRAGAWMNAFRTGSPPDKDRGREPHLGLMCGNLTAPLEGKPALLKHYEVETIFHEFGHLLHHLLGNVRIRSLNGIHVAWDFVELPSQIMENFCWARESLDQFAKHFETGKVIPEELFEKMTRARTFQAAMATMRQLSLAKLDLELHCRYHKESDQDLDTWIEDLLKDFKIPTKTQSPHIANRFSHLFSSPTGYAAGYYSYKWAELLDADAFTRFKENGVLNPQIGLEFREKVLSQGNAKDPGELFHDFMGRDPQLDALLERSGLTKVA